mgnify:CR=1 FL=1
MNIQGIETQDTEWGPEDEMVLHRERLYHLQQDQQRIRDEQMEECNIFGGLE